MKDAVLKGLTRENLMQHVEEVLNRGRSRNPDVYLVAFQGERFVVKDFAPRSASVRKWVGPRINRREIRAYRVLEGHPAVPRFLGEIDSLAFAVEYRPGRYISRSLRGKVMPEFVTELADAIDEMHERGVVHLDLRHRSNVLCGEDGHPILIDFASAFCFAPGSLVARTLLPLLARVDLGALAKWKVSLRELP